MARSSPHDEVDPVGRIDEIIAAFPAQQAAALTSLRSTLRRLLPGSAEAIAYGIPAVKIGPDQVMCFTGFAKHNSVFPDPHVASVIATEYPDLTTTKGTVHLDRDKAPPVSLIRRIVSLRITEINGTYPRANGKTRRYYTNGCTEYTGSLRDGEMHGRWEWFRRNGVIKRSGKFKAGEPVGEWITYDAQGRPYRTTLKG
jgi:uncharacterized protein YdhG (YjbR/CyaY superfamily)